VARTHLEQRYALLEKLAELTPKMRAAQVNYFKTRDKSYMRESIELEARVDEINVRLDKIMIGALKKIWDTADKYRITLRTATFAVACERILSARQERGLYP
jgi:uncharacterized protein with PhoU and TrkA domain